MTGALAGPCDAAVASSVATCANRHPVATLAATILGSSLAFVDGSVVNVALAAFERDLGAGPSGLAWIINAYLLPLGALILVGGAAGDHQGRRRLFLAGVALFGVASALCALAPSLGWLLAGRALQGIGAALLMPNSLAILGAAFEKEARGRAIGTWAAVGALAAAVGPVLGGWLLDVAGWRAIFLINLPVAAAAAWLAWRYVPESRGGAEARPLDWRGALMATIALFCLTWSLTVAAEGGAAPGLVWAAAAAGVVLILLLGWHERRQGDDAIVPRTMFSAPGFLGLTLFTFFLYAALSGLLVLLPYVLMQTEDYSAVAAGAALLPLPVLIGLGSPLMGGLAARIGGRWLLGTGALLVAAGMVLYLRLNPGGITYWTDVLPATLLVAVGMAISVAPLTTSVMAAVDAAHVGAASGFNSAVARVGGLVATALVGFVFAQEGAPETFLAAVHAAALWGAGLALAAAACAILLTPARQKASAERRHFDE